MLPEKKAFLTLKDFVKRSYETSKKRKSGCGRPKGDVQPLPSKYLRTVKQAKLGDKYGRLTITESLGKDIYGRHLWKVECYCGRRAIVHGGALSREDGARSCGCKGRGIVAESYFDRQPLDVSPAAYQELACRLFNCLIEDGAFLERRFRKGGLTKQGSPFASKVERKKTYDKMADQNEALSGLDLVLEPDHPLFVHWATATNFITPHEFRRQFQAWFPMTFAYLRGY